MVLAAATAATAIDQQVEAQVLPADQLGLQIEEMIYIGGEVNQTSDMNYFGMQVLNTTATGWEITATSTDLAGYYMDNCDEFGENCEVVLTGVTIPASALLLTGGDQDDWGDPGAITPEATGALDNSVPLLIMSGTNVPQGWFGINDPSPAIQFDVPDDGTLADGSGQFMATVTYTIAEPTP